MKIKYSVIPFIPITLAMIGFKLASLFGLDSDGYFLGMNGMTITYLVIGLTLALFVISIIINIFDRKTAPVYAVKKNPVAGILAIVSGLAVAASSFLGIVSDQAEATYYIMTLITAVLAVPAAIALILMSKVHFIGRATSSGVSILYIFPSLWGCAELVTCFLNATKVSISSTDMTGLFCYIFITLYLFSHSMIVSRIKGRNPVKACFIYGLPASAISITFGIYEILYALRAVENLGLSTVLVGAELVAVGAYALSFIIELAFNTLTKDEVEIIDNMPEDNSPEEKNYESNIGYNDLVFSDAPSSKETKDSGISDYMTNVSGLNDFIMGYDSEEPVPYLTKEELKNSSIANDLLVGIPNFSKEESVDKGNNPVVADEPVAQKPKKQNDYSVLKKDSTDKAENTQLPADKPKKPNRKPAKKNAAQKQNAEPNTEKPATPKQAAPKPQRPAAPKQKAEPMPKKPSAPSADDELEQILNEAKRNRRVSEPVPQSKADKKPGEVASAPQKKLSDVDELLKTLEDMS